MAKVLETLACGGGGRCAARATAEPSGPAGEIGGGVGEVPRLRPFGIPPPCASPKFCSWLTFPRQLPRSTHLAARLCGGPEVLRDRPAPRFHLLGRTPFRPRARGWRSLPDPSSPRGAVRERVRGGACPRGPAAAVEGSCRENVSGRKPPCGVCERRVGVLRPLSPAVPTHCPGLGKI